MRETIQLSRELTDWMNDISKYTDLGRDCELMSYLANSSVI